MINTNFKICTHKEYVLPGNIERTDLVIKSIGQVNEQSVELGLVFLLVVLLIDICQMLSTLSSFEYAENLRL